MVWFDRDPFSLLSASTGFDTMVRMADRRGSALASPRTSKACGPMASALGAAAGQVNVDVTEAAATLTSLVPGFGPDDIQLSVRDRSVRLQAQTGDRQIDRSLRMPFPVSADEVRASVVDGVLSLTLPRRGDDRPTSIPIEGAAAGDASADPNVAHEVAPEGDAEGDAMGDASETKATLASNADAKPSLPRLRPRASARRTESGLELTIRIPGARRDSIELGVEEGELHVTSETTFAAEADDVRASFREFRVAGSYEGRWALPEDLDPEQAASRFVNGELIVDVPVRAQVRRSITVE